MPSAAIRFVRRATLAAGLVGALAACDRGEKGAPVDAGPEAAAPAPSAAPAQSSRSSAESSQAVYPITSDPPDPRAGRLCEALNSVPADRKAACCKVTRGFVQTAECTRTLSASMRTGAIKVSDAAIDACSAAMAKQHEGCAWVGPSPQKVPEACLGVVRGTLKTTMKCRSSLECEDGLRCQGVGPTDIGVCLPPKPPGYACDTAVDPLAGFVRQSDDDDRHPECDGHCARRRCMEAVAVGAACKTRVDCGPEKACVGGKCSELPTPSLGQPCEGDCEGEARCLGGQCVAPRLEGESCGAERECLGGCVRPDGGALGTCGMKCPRGGLGP